MIKEKIEIINDAGLNQKQGNEILNLVETFESEIELETENKKRIKLNSILKILSLGIKKGDKITIIATGIDEEIATQKVVDFLKNLKD